MNKNMQRDRVILDTVVEAPISVGERIVIALLGISKYLAVIFLSYVACKVAEVSTYLGRGFSSAKFNLTQGAPFSTNMILLLIIAVLLGMLGGRLCIGPESDTPVKILIKALVLLVPITVSALLGFRESDPIWMTYDMLLFHNAMIEGILLYRWNCFARRKEQEINNILVERMATVIVEEQVLPQEDDYWK